MTLTRQMYYVNFCNSRMKKAITSNVSFYFTLSPSSGMFGNHFITIFKRHFFKRQKGIQKSLLKRHTDCVLFIFHDRKRVAHSPVLDLEKVFMFLFLIWLKSWMGWLNFDCIEIIFTHLTVLAALGIMIRWE